MKRWTKTTLSLKKKRSSSVRQCTDLPCLHGLLTCKWTELLARCVHAYKSVLLRVSTVLTVGQRTARTENTCMPADLLVQICSFLSTFCRHCSAEILQIFPLTLLVLLCLVCSITWLFFMITECILAEKKKKDFVGPVRSNVGLVDYWACTVIWEQGCYCER